MMKHWSKALLTGAILASLLGATAFAADLGATNDSGTKPPAMDQRGPGFGPGPKMHGPHHMKGDRQRLPQLTEAQRQELDAQRREIFAKWPQMSDQERRTAQLQFRQQVRKTALSNLTVEEQAEYYKKEAEQKQKRKEFREKWKNMSQDERNAWREKKHQEFVKERTQNMSAEEKERFLKKDAEMQKRFAAQRERWNNMTPEEKEQWKKDHARPQRPRMTSDDPRHSRAFQIPGEHRGPGPRDDKHGPDDRGPRGPHHGPHGERGMHGPQGGPPPDAPQGEPAPKAE